MRLILSQHGVEVPRAHILRSSCQAQILTVQFIELV